MARFRFGVAAAALACAFPACAMAQSAFVVPDWPYPLPPAPAPLAFDSVVRLRVPRSAQSFTKAQVMNRFDVADWQPRSHAPMPKPVSQGQRGRIFACAYCHEPDGTGRPENAMLAGLPAEYIVRQVGDMHTGARSGANAAAYPTNVAMRNVADSVTRDELLEAARYFSQLRPRRKTRVVEASVIPRPLPQLGLHFPAPDGSKEPLGVRLIEMPTEPERHELHDPNLGYVAYVPRGSLARGRALATAVSRDTSIKSCTSCHGPQLRGVGPVPPIAGRSPSYLLRQLLAFRTGARATPASVPMNEVAKRLSLEDMIAAAAYVGSKEPQ